MGGVCASKGNKQKTVPNDCVKNTRKPPTSFEKVQPEKKLHTGDRGSSSETKCLLPKVDSSHKYIPEIDNKEKTQPEKKQDTADRMGSISENNCLLPEVDSGLDYKAAIDNKEDKDDPEGENEISIEKNGTANGEIQGHPTTKPCSEIETQNQSQNEGDAKKVPTSEEPQVIEEQSNADFSGLKINDNQKLEPEAKSNVDNLENIDGDNKVDEVGANGKMETSVEKEKAETPEVFNIQPLGSGNDGAKSNPQEQIQEQEPKQEDPLKVEDNNVINAVEKSNLKLQTISTLERTRVLNLKFDKIDTNGDNKISEEEFLVAWKTCGNVNLNGKNAFTNIDRNGTGFITRKDFNNFYLLQTYDEIISDFMKMVNDELQISKSNFQKAWMSKYPCSTSDAEKLFQKLDVNNDGVLSFKEFKDGTEQDYVVRTLQKYMNFGGVDEIMSRREEKLEDITKFHMIFENGIAKLNNSSPMEAFNQIDWELKDRLLTLVEVKKYFGLQGVDETDCETLYNDFDKNGDGVVTYTEFKNYLNRQTGSMTN